VLGVVVHPGSPVERRGRGVRATHVTHGMLDDVTGNSAAVVMHSGVVRASKVAKRGIGLLVLHG
jgi:hypothetical protein